MAQTQSGGLSKRLTQLVKDGRRLNDDSFDSESTLTQAINDEIIPYLKEKCESVGGILVYKKSISLYECQQYFYKSQDEVKVQLNEENKKVFMRPDGGIFIMSLNEDNIPLLIIEDKVQGTNDLLYEQNKKRQATGNAIERAAKNIRGAEMIFANQSIFPYVIFASGCDFHHSETISKRIEMMNYGIPNHYIEIGPNKTQKDTDEKIDEIVKCINIIKLSGKSVASVFVKAHKYDSMKHGASLWKKQEIVSIIKKIIDKVFETKMICNE